MFFFFLPQNSNKNLAPLLTCISFIICSGILWVFCLNVFFTKIKAIHVARKCPPKEKHTGEEEQKEWRGEKVNGKNFQGKLD